MLAESIWWIGGTMQTIDSEVHGGKPVSLATLVWQEAWE